MKTLRYILFIIFACSSALAAAQQFNTHHKVEISPSDALLQDPTIQVASPQGEIISSPVVSAPTVSDPTYQYSNSMTDRRISMKVTPVNTSTNRNAIAAASRSGAARAGALPGARGGGGSLGTDGRFSSGAPDWAGNRVNPGGHLNFGGNGVGNGGSSGSNNGLHNGDNRHPGELSPIGNALIPLLLLLAGYVVFLLLRRRSGRRKTDD